MTWHQLKTLCVSSEFKITADFQIPADSKWFIGHFPERPVLPGLAQLSLVSDVIEKGYDDSFRVSGFSRIKFKKMIMPGALLHIEVERKKMENPLIMSFTLSMSKEWVCKGLVHIRAAEKREETFKGDY